jgi:hypothetical protein
MNNSHYFKDVLLEYACFKLDEHSVESMQFVLTQTANKIHTDVVAYMRTGKPVYIQYLFGCKPSQKEQISQLETVLLRPLREFTANNPDSMLHSLNMIRASAFRSEHGDEVDTDLVVQDIVNSFVSLQKRPMYYK